MYNYVEPEDARNDKHVILAVNESSYTGGKVGDWHPVSWVRYHYPAQSRIWVTTLGHTIEAYNYSRSTNITSRYFQKHLIRGIEWTVNGTAHARSRWRNIVEDFTE
ncbi:Crp/Fnr family transcriptional regulator [Gracilaria domingensis]|nr:Crp/Fnr family transcriptional regulator [Gracilaria domingensis]